MQSTDLIERYALKKLHQTNLILFLSRKRKVYKNTMNSINLWNRMDTIFMNSENSKASDPRRLLLSLTDNVNFKWSDKYVGLSNLDIYFT